MSRAVCDVADHWSLNQCDSFFVAQANRVTPYKVQTHLNKRGNLKIRVKVVAKSQTNDRFYMLNF
jgi:hypothetical protein